MTVAGVFEMLAAEHGLLTHVLDELADSREHSGRVMLVERLNNLLCAHAAFEEKALHPLLRPPYDHLARTAAGEHRQALDGLSTLNQATSASSVESAEGVFEAVVTILRATLAAHSDNDERRLFPFVRAISDQATIDSLGTRLLTMRYEIDIGLRPRG